MNKVKETVVSSLKHGVSYIYKAVLKPTSDNEDSRRREFILNIILGSSILLLMVLDGFILYSSIYRGENYRGIPFLFFTAIVAVFILLLMLSRYGAYIAASYILIFIYFLCVSYAAHVWGIRLPNTLLGYALIIVISSILISTRFSTLVTATIALTTIAIGYTETAGIHTPREYWRFEPLELKEAFQFSIIYTLIMTVSWLANREIERSLDRARKSEHELAKERDSLEIIVEQRTQELRRVELEKMAQLYRFAEFGKLSSGVFHDLINPLSALILNIEQLQKSGVNTGSANIHISNSIKASRRMESFINAIRKQLETNPEKLTEINIKSEIFDAIQIMNYKARKNDVELESNVKVDPMIVGNHIKFHQILTNLISNAIDAYDGTTIKNKKVWIGLQENDKEIVLSVTDAGIGIDDINIEKIFDPFFSTKCIGKGLGIGLSSTRQFIERDFSGKILVKSEKNKGTSLIVQIPKNSA